MSKEELEKEIKTNLVHLNIFIARYVHLWELVDKNALIPPPLREELDKYLETMKHYTNLIQEGQKRLALCRYT